MKGGFNHPLLPSFTPGEKQYGGRIRWHLEITTIPSVTKLGAFSLLYIAPFFLQVTMDYDLVSIPKVLSAFATMKGMILNDRNHNERYTEMD
jgi:hypothetical protein